MVLALAFPGLKRLLPLRLTTSSWLACNHIMTFYFAAQMLSSSVEYLSARLYNSSIVTCEFRDSEWKKGVDLANLLLKFCKTASML